MELFHLYAGVEHVLPHETDDVRYCYEMAPLLGLGVSQTDLARASFIPFRMTGTPIGRTDLLGGARPFLVMTPRLLLFLESLGDFPHQTIPAHLVQDRDDWRDHPPIDTTSFVVCNLHQHLHIIDFERSELEPITRSPGMCRVHQIALVYGVNVPPLFRQDNWPGPPLIPKSTRDALLAAGFTALFMPPLLGDALHLSDIRDPQ